MKKPRRTAWSKNGDHVKDAARRNLRPAAGASSHSGPFHRVPRWHGVRLLVSSGHALAADEPRRASDGTLYQIVLEHFETFCARAASLRDGEGLPRFVEQAAFARSATASRAEALAEAGVPGLSAVRLVGRFARFRCGACGLDRLVLFSCRVAASVRVAAGAGWRSVRRIWWTTCFPFSR